MVSCGLCNRTAALCKLCTSQIEDSTSTPWATLGAFEFGKSLVVFAGKGHLPCTISQRSYSNLTFANHIKTTVLECIARLVQISRVKYCLDRVLLLTAINALVFSKLYYCSNVWANTTEKNIRKLQAVQNFACRIVSGARKYM